MVRQQHGARSIEALALARGFLITAECFVGHPDREGLGQSAPRLFRSMRV
jgi:hypothetical protein